MSGLEYPGDQRRALILLSGGLDSATVLAVARTQGFSCYALSFNYGQRHVLELQAARRVAAQLGVSAHKIVDLDLGSLGGSALTDFSLDLLESPQPGIPNTYVPARNTLFLSYALAWAEVLQIQDIFIGVNAIDYSGYPDCRPEYIHAFERMANLATRAAVEGQALCIHAPLIALSKQQIIAWGTGLGVDYSLTLSCYQPDAEQGACGRCDSCRLRRAGFIGAGIADPTHYFSE